MKTFKIMTMLILLAGFMACKKNEANSKAKEIETAELLDYYIVAEHEIGANKLMMLYFIQENNTIKAQMHLLNDKRVKEVTLNQSAFKIDYYGDGKAIYNFTVEKDEVGKLRLKSYSFSFNGQGNELVFATIVKKRAAPVFTGLSYKMIPSNTPFERIGTGTPFSIYAGSGGGNRGALVWSNGVGPHFDDIINIGFKTADGAYMAVSLPNWKKIDIPIMLLENKTTLFIAAKQ